MKYVLITPAHNEAAFIQKTLDSMVAQTLLPERWVIVDDGSTDRTVGNCAGLCETLSLDRKRFSFEGPALLFGYCWGALRRINRPVSSQLMQFYRHEQMEKLKAIILSWCKLKRVDNFHLTPERK